MYQWNKKVSCSGVATPGPGPGKSRFGPGKICFGPCKNVHAVPRAVKGFSLRAVILINLITAYTKSLEYSFVVDAVQAAFVV